jgi:D-alanine-D-alanine ligase-like ATP-grasp enzyme
MKCETAVVLVDPEVLRPGTVRLNAGQPERFVVRSLRRFAGRVAIHPFTCVAAFLKMLEDERPSLVFNLTEHVYGDRRMDSHICALMELERIAYTGTGPTGMALCRDKALSKVMAERAGFRVPGWFATKTLQPRLAPGVQFPLVVKPRFGDGSEGIGQNSLVASHTDLMARIRALGTGGVKDAICEEYIAGREMVIAIAGKRTMPVREFVVGRKGDGAPVLACQRFKHDKAYRRRWRVRMVFAELTRAEQRTLSEMALRTFESGVGAVSAVVFGKLGGRGFRLVGEGDRDVGDAAGRVTQGNESRALGALSRTRDLGRGAPVPVANDSKLLSSSKTRGAEYGADRSVAGEG